MSAAEFVFVERSDHGRAMEAMLEMSKIDVAELRRAFDGEQAR